MPMSRIRPAMKECFPASWSLVNVGLFLVMAGWTMVLGNRDCRAEAKGISAASASRLDAVACVDSAVYSADLHDLEITGGSLQLDISRQGTGPAMLNWTGVTTAIHQLKWNSQSLVSGTTPRDEMVIFTNRPHDRLTGKWSAHGKLISQMAVFDLVLPAALNTQLVLRLPPDLVMESSHGVLTASAHRIQGKRQWTLELGHVNSTTLMVGPSQEFQRGVPPRYEIETEHRARRDGIFIKSDLMIDGRTSGLSSLQLHVPAAVELQSVTIFSGSVQVGATLSFDRDPSRPDLVTIPLKNLNLESRLTLRLRGFQPVTWGKPHLLPDISLASALETKRIVIMRVEQPLQLQTVNVHGMLQTSLASEETVGEVWKFEAREPESSLSVLIDLPRSNIVADIQCLTDARQFSCWAAMVVSMHVDHGSRFDAALQIPEDWRLISVAPGDTESRLTSWTIDQNLLNVSWQNPMTATSQRQLLLFARTAPWKREVPTRLQLPLLRQAESVAVQYQILLPPGMELQMIEGEGWRHQEHQPIATSLLRLREISERIPDARSLTCMTLHSRNDLHPTRTLVRLATKTQSGESISVSAPEAGTSPDPKPAPPSSESALAGATASASAPDDPSQDSAVPTATLQLLTMVGPSLERGCVHHAELQFDRPMVASQLNLMLPLECRLSAVEIDGRSVTVFRNGREIPLPSEILTAEKISLTYMTPPGTGWLYQKNEVPLPRIAFPIAGVSWALDVPRDQRLAEIDVPGVLSVTAADRSLSRRYFGPLTRMAHQRIFNPFSRRDWDALRENQRIVNTTLPNRRTIQFLAPTAGKRLEFVIWDSAHVRHFAWVALLGCLMIGSAARLFRIEWIRHVSVLWLIVLFAAAAITPSAWTLILGGMFCGSLLSLLIPRRWMQNRDLLRPGRPRQNMGRQIVTATAILLAISLGGIPGPLAAAPNDSPSATTQKESPTSEVKPKIPASRSAEEKSPTMPDAKSGKKPPEIGSPTSASKRSAVAVPENAAYPLYLIESARYELIRLQPIPQINATFIIQTRPHFEEIFVRIPLQDVILPSTAECLVNGVRKTLIPSLAGDAIMIGLAAEETGKIVSPESGWDRHEIQLEFSIRPSGGINDVDPMMIPFRAVVPVVLNSTLKVPSQFLSFPFGRWGEVVSQGAGSATLSLGGIGQLRSNFQAAGPVDAQGASAITMLDVTPLRFKGQMRLVPGPQGWPGELPLTLPPGCLVSSVSGNSLIDFVDAPGDAKATQITLRLRKGVPSSPVIVNFELPGGPPNPMELVIPPFLLWNGPNMVHSLGISGPSTSSLSLVKTPGAIPLAPEEWPTEGDAGRIRPAIAVMLTSPQQLQLSWNQLNPVRTATIAQQLTLQRENIAWSARIQMNVSQITTFIHPFRVDPNVHIEAITAGETGAESGIRYSRSGSTLNIFIPGGQIGDKTFQIHGSLPITTDAWMTVPMLEALNTSVTDMRLTIQDRTGWNLDLESAPGVPAESMVSAGEIPAPQNGVRTMGIFRRESGAMPQRFRVVMPPESTRADSVLKLQPSTGDHWEAITTFHLTALESSLKKVIFRVPPEMTGIHIRPSLYQFTATTDATGTIVKVKIPERYSSSATMTILARLKQPISELATETLEPDRPRQNFPLIEVLSAQKTSQFVLVDAKSPYVPSPTGSLRIDAAAFPSWAPMEWVREVKEHALVCYQQIRKGLSIVSRDASDLSGRPLIHLEETILWPETENLYRGLTRIWLTSKDNRQFRILHSSDLSIQSMATAEHQAIPWTRIPTGTELQLPPGKQVSEIICQWSRKTNDGKLALLQYDQAPRRRLAGIACPDRWTYLPGKQRLESVVQVWLDRWEALLNSLENVSGPIPVDSLLLKNIRQCQNEVTRLLTRPNGKGDEALRERFQKLSQDWTMLKNNLVISGDRPAAKESAIASSFTELLEQENAGLRLQWISPEASMGLGQLHQLNSLGYQQHIFWAGLLAMGALSLVVRFSRQLSSLREAFGRQPSWSLVVLGLVWWLCLAPSLAGLILIAGVLSWNLIRMLVLKWIQFRQRRSVPT